MLGPKQKNMRRGEVNIPSEDWDLVYQTLSANRSSKMFDMSESDLFQLLAAAIYIMPDTPFLYLSGIVSTEPPLQFPPKSSMTSLLTDVDVE